MFSETKLADSGMAECLYHHKSPFKPENATVRHVNAIHNYMTVYKCVMGPYRASRASYVLSYGCFGGATAKCYALRRNATYYGQMLRFRLCYATLRSATCYAVASHRKCYAQGTPYS